MNALWMIAASFLFACMGVCVKLAAQQFSAGELVFYRGLVATMILGAYIGWRRLPLATPHAVAHLWRGLAGVVSLTAYFHAIALIPLATAVTLGYTSPLFLALLLVFWAREGQAAHLYPALAAGFLGVVLVLQPTFDQHHWAGGVLGLASGVISSVAYFNVRRLGELGEPEWRTVFYFSLVSTLGGLPWLLASKPSGAASTDGWLLVLGVGSFGAAAQWCMTRAYARGRTLATASLAFSTVIFSSLFGLLVWHDRLSASAWGGMALIVGAGIAATRPSAQRRPAAAEL
jgi:drug/metabolite transporter (DMT)-like permease